MAKQKFRSRKQPWLKPSWFVRFLKVFNFAKRLLNFIWNQPLTFKLFKEQRQFSLAWQRSFVVHLLLLILLAIAWHQGKDKKSLLPIPPVPLQRSQIIQASMVSHLPEAPALKKIVSHPPSKSISPSKTSQAEPLKKTPAKTLTIPTKPEPLALPKKPPKSEQKKPLKKASRKEEKLQRQKEQLPDSKVVKKPPTHKSVAHTPSKPKVVKAPPTKKTSEKIPHKPDRQKMLAELKAFSQSAIANSIAQQQAQARQTKQKEQYLGLIQQEIKHNWNNPFYGDGNNYQVILKIELDKNGNVKQVNIAQSSGNTTFDRAVIQAVWKSSPLPIPDDEQLRNKWFHELTLQFNNQ